MFSVHRKQTPFVVVGSLKIYEKLHDLGWYGRRLCGAFPTVFLYEVGGMRGSRIFCRGGGGGVQARLPENSSDNFFSPQLYRGCPIVISNKTIIFNIFGGGGGPDPLPPSGSAHGETVRVHMPILSLRCLQMRQVHG